MGSHPIAFRAVLALGLCAGSVAELEARQTYTVRGRIVDAASAVSIAGASVAVDEVTRAQTGTDGSFVIRDVAAGMRRIAVTSIGYRPAMFELEVRADTMLRIELEVRPVPLDPLDVRTRSVTVRGRVTDATTGRAIFDADIIAGEERVATDVDGRFGIGRVPAHDEVVVEVRALEYLPQRIVLEPVADTAIDVSLTPDPVGRRLIAAKVAEIDHRSLHSPFGRRLVPREDVVLKASWTAAELVQDRMYLRRSIGCLIVDEQQVMIPPMEYLRTIIAPQVHHIEILTYQRAVTVRLYTRRFMERMIDGTGSLRVLVPRFCG